MGPPSRPRIRPRMWDVGQAPTVGRPDTRWCGGNAAQTQRGRSQFRPAFHGCQKKIALDIMSPIQGGRTDGAKPDRPGQAGLEAPRPHRCQRHPARGSPDGRERARQHDAGGGGRCRAADPAVLGTTQAQAQQAPRRQGLRSPPLPSCLDPPSHPASHRSTRYREQRKARTAQVGRRTDPGVVQPVQAPCHPLRA